MPNLKEARKKGKLEDFIKEHENDAEGDLDKLDAALKQARGTGKEARKASSQASDDD